jgi:hypothetical protein
VAALREAIGLDEECRAEARTDPDFVSLRGDAAFDALVGADG